MPFRSRYAGKCSKCGLAIEVGQFIAWSRKSHAAWHVDCSNVNAESTQEDNNADTQREDSVNSDAHTDTNSSDGRPNNDILAILAEGLTPHLKPQSAINEKQVLALIDKALAGFSPVQTISISIEVKRESGEIKRIDGAHANMPCLMYLVSKRHHTYLYGPPGSGKSTAAKQVSDALGLPYGYLSLNPQTPDSRVLGYMDANGNYRSTPFRNVYQNGGVFCIDEMDNASPSLLTTLNSGLENGHMAFPDGLVAKHADFVLIATGNTCGRGANPMFPERRPFDAAFSERFSFIEWDYDLALERAITLAINPKAQEWLNWTTTVREYCKRNFPKVLVTPRASFKGAEYLRDGGLTSKQIADMVIFKGLDSASREQILRDNPFWS